MRSRNSASRTAGGHRATTAACDRLRDRTRGGISHAARGGSQGTGVTCPLAERFPSHCRPASRSESWLVRLRIALSSTARSVHVASRCSDLGTCCAGPTSPSPTARGYRPKLSFGSLSTGHESEGEYLDVDLDPEQGADLDPRGAHHPPQCSAAGGHDRNRSGRCRPPDAVAAAGSHLVHCRSTSATLMSPRRKLRSTQPLRRTNS